jgi:dTDP-4-amino-4,6-dideoxygalactose transaminase
MTAIKRTLSDLALFGGEPAFEEMLHVGRPNIGDREQLFARLNEILDRRWLTNNGPVVREFEERLAAFLGVRHAITVVNATIGLELVIRALDLTGEVIVPSFTFVATAHALQWQEIRPMFADIDPATHTLDPAQVERMITPRTTGIIGVHVWGRPCQIEALEAIARRHDLKLIFDAAHAFAASHHGRMIGNFGHAEVFSFHATKFFNTFEGGVITTNDDDLAHKLRLMRNFGFAGMDNVIYIGTNGKMHEFTAAAGLTALESLNTFVETNRRNYHTYHRELADIPGVHMLSYDEKEQRNFQYIVLEIDANTTGIHRNLLMRLLHAEQVRARRYFYPGVHRMEPYRSLYPHAGLLLPQTERLVDRVLCLPTGTAVNEDAIARIAEIIRFAAAHGPEITRLLEDER